MNTGKIRLGNSSLQVNRCVALRWQRCRARLSFGTLDDNVSILAQTKAPLENGKTLPSHPLGLEGKAVQRDWYGEDNVWR